MTTMILNAFIRINGFKLTTRKKGESIKDHIKRHEDKNKGNNTK